MVGNPDNLTQNMIISPEVKAYVEAHFDCDADNDVSAQTARGAVLSDRDNSHWNYTLYFNQLMVPFFSTIDNRPTGLTTRLLRDTGRYAYVDVEPAWELAFGKGQGCDFMRGTNITYSGSLTCVGQDSCNAEGYLAGNCQNGNVRGGYDARCQVIQAENGCFQTASGIPNCFQAVCLDDNTHIDFNVGNGNTGHCWQGNPDPERPDTPTVTVNFDGVDTVFNCPPDFQLFCNSVACPNWCQEKGVCIAGECCLDTCREEIKGCRFCVQDRTQVVTCRQCEEGLTLANNMCSYTGGNCTINFCSSCTIDVNDAVCCAACNTNFQLSQNQLSCTPICGDIIDNCLQCNADGSVCTSCDNNMIPNGDGSACVPQVADCTPIPGCNTCHLQGVTLICDSCNGALALNTAGTECLACNIPSCSKCQADVTDAVTCMECSGILAVSSNGLDCEDCGIALCDKCADATDCLTCTGDLSQPDCSVPTGADCDDVIDNCMTCKDDGNDGSVECDVCTAPFAVSNDGSECLMCSIGQCLQCVANPDDSVSCQNCRGDLIPNTGSNPSGDTCVFPACISVIPNCMTCDNDDDNDGLLQCQACIQDYVLDTSDNRRCIECDIENCAQCAYDAGTQTLTCTECQGRFAVINNGLNCADCSIELCDKCADGTDCMTCTGDLLQPDCSVPTGADCDDVIDNCMTCKDDGNDGSVECDQCTAPFAVSNDESECLQCSIGQCLQCVANSQGSTFAVSCSNCRGDFVPNADSTPPGDTCRIPACMSVIPNCMTCDSDDDDDGLLQCQGCIQGYVLDTSDNRQCIECDIENCAQCAYDADTQTLTCTECQGRFAVINNGLNCVDCSIELCDKCADGTNCMTCTGDLLQPGCTVPTGADCDDVITNCMTCKDDGNDGSVECDQCTAPTVVNSDESECLACSIDECQQCAANPDDSVSCSNCRGDYIPNPASSPVGDTCVLADCMNVIPNCMTCDSDDDDDGLLECQACISGYVLDTSDNRQCIECDIENCAQCAYDADTQILTCTECQGRLAVSSNGLTCEDCSIELCDKCADGTNCMTCTGDLLEPSCSLPTGDDCDDVIDSCMTCKDDGNNGSVQCDVCDSPFVLSANELACLPCDIQHCNSCENRGNTDVVVCIDCQGQLVPNEDGQCAPAADCSPLTGCSECQPQENAPTMIECTQCSVSTSTVSFDKLNCISCTTISTCIRCQVTDSSDNIRCLQCSGQLTGDNCDLVPVDCGSAIDNCQVCVDQDTDGVLQCTECSETYVLNPNDDRQCLPCDTPNCLSCVFGMTGDPAAPAAVCDQCQGDWQLNDLTKLCEVPDCNSFDTQCDQCNIDPDTDVFMCTNCADGSDPLGKECCDITNCVDCIFNVSQSRQQCSECEANYDQANEDTECVINCGRAIDNCNTCNADGSVCDDCDGDLVPQPQIVENTRLLNQVAGDACIVPLDCAPITNCVTCNDDDEDTFITCTECPEGYVLRGDGRQCIECTFENCNECSLHPDNEDSDSDLVCSDCAGDLVENSNPTSDADGCEVPQCTQIPNCLACDFDSQTFDETCNSCDNGEPSEDGEECISDDFDCTEISPNCEECTRVNGRPVCTACAENFSPVRGLCLFCGIPNCVRCDIIRFVNRGRYPYFFSTYGCVQCVAPLRPNRPGRRCIR